MPGLLPPAGMLHYLRLQQEHQAAAGVEGPAAPAVRAPVNADKHHEQPETRHAQRPPLPKGAGMPALAAPQVQQHVRQHSWAEQGGRQLGQAGAAQHGCTDNVHAASGGQPVGC